MLKSLLEVHVRATTHPFVNQCISGSSLLGLLRESSSPSSLDLSLCCSIPWVNIHKCNSNADSSLFWLHAAAIVFPSQLWYIYIYSNNQTDTGYKKENKCSRYVSTTHCFHNTSFASKPYSTCANDFGSEHVQTTTIAISWAPTIAWGCALTAQGSQRRTDRERLNTKPKHSDKIRANSSPLWRRRIREW